MESVGVTASLVEGDINDQKEQRSSESHLLQRSTGTETIAELFGVESEVALLRRVLVHRPGQELDRVLPDNLEELLFDEVPWRTAAQREHDVFTTLLRRHGVEVCYLDDLVTRSLAETAVRHELIEAALNPVELGEELYTAYRDHLVLQR